VAEQDKPRAQIGRNDPCHCGSGKKYKHCHLRSDEQNQAAVQRAAFPAPQPLEDSAIEPPEASMSLQQVANLVRDLSRGAPGGVGLESQLLARIEPIMAYMEQKERIEAASTELEKHQAEFEELIQDRQAYGNRCRALFEEECFRPFRFTAADIRRAFERVGYLSNLSQNDETLQKLRAAILYLADKERRTHLSMGLLAHLPQFVAEGRYLDGWVIQGCAQMTAETDGDSPFLFHMFSCGYEAWMHEKHISDRALLHDFGLDPDRIKNMSFEELDAYLKQVQNDPAKMARFESVLEQRPEWRTEALSAFQSTQADFATLLEREEAAPLLLSAEELELVLPVINRHSEAAQKKHPGLLEGTKKAPAKTLFKVILPMLEEICQTVYTEARIQQLIAELLKFRNSQFNAGDKAAAACAHAAVTSLETRKNPCDNSFLLAICFTSLRSGSSRKRKPAPAE
jgi:hypothetical protein